MTTAHAARAPVAPTPRAGRAETTATAADRPRVRAKSAPAEAAADAVAVEAAHRFAGLPGNPLLSGDRPSALASDYFGERAIANVRVRPDRRREGDRAGARAFTARGDVIWGAAAPPIAAVAATSLLAHELAHIALGHPAGHADGAADGGRTGLESLTNADFLVEMIAAAAPDADAIRRAAVEAERTRRVSLGHRWLIPGLNHTPRLVRLRSDNGGGSVESADADALQGATETSEAPVVSAEQYAAMIDSGNEGGAAAPRPALMSGGEPPPVPRKPGTVTASRGGQSLPYAIVDPRSVANIPGIAVVEVPGQSLARRGQPARPQLRIGEAAALNDTAFPKTSLRALVAFDNGQPIGLGLDRIDLFRSHAFNGYVESRLQSGGVGRVLTGKRMLDALRAGATDMSLMVNDIGRMPRTERPGNAMTAIEIFHNDMARIANPALYGSQTLLGGEKYSFDAQEMARVALSPEFGGDSLSTIERQLLQRIAAGDPAAQAMLHATPPSQTPRDRLDAARIRSLPPSGGTRFNDAFRALTASPLTPEYQATGVFGPGGVVRGAGQSGALGALLSPTIDLATTAYQGGDLSAAGARAWHDAKLGAAGGVAAGAAEATLVKAVSTQLIQRGVTPGLLTGLSITGARSISGGIGAGAVEVIVMATEDRDHSAREITLRTGRSVGIGTVSAGASVLTTAGVVAAIAAFGAKGAGVGTVGAGPAGTAIGFVVGLAVGTVVYVVLDKAVPKVDAR